MPDEAGVQIVLDLICAPSYIALTRFNRVLAARRAAGATVTVSFLPFELSPGASTAGEPALEVLERLFGAEGIAQARRLAALAAQDGLVLDYDRGVATGSFHAHRIVAQAARHGLAEAMVERLFRANFTDGANIGDRATLVRLAKEVGFTPDDSGAAQTQAALDGVRGVGISSIPVFLFSSGEAIAGLQPEQAFADALDRLLSSTATPR